MRRARRPLLALIALVLLLGIGYAVRAVRSDDAHHPDTSSSSTP